MAGLKANPGTAPAHLVQVQGEGASLGHFAIMRISPETAPSLLARKRPGAGRNPAAVAAYAQAMRSGEWVLNGMPIILSRSGVLLDGVQRLYACLEAQTPFITVYVEGVPDDTLHTIDQQRRRSFTGVLETRGIPRPAAVAGLLAKLIRYDDGTLTRGTSTPPWSRMERALEANRVEIDTAVKFSFDSPARVLTESIRSPLAFMGLQVDRHAIRRLLDAIAHPERFEAGEPGVMIRRRLVEGRADRAHRLSPVALFAVAIKALNDTVAGTRSDAYTWSDGARGTRAEPFPRLAGYPGLKDPVAGEQRESALARVVETAEAALADPFAFPMTIETITPDRAEEYLAHNRGNRNIVQSHVAALARDITAGQWMFNAQPICFSRSGRLLNGQHRLSAVLEAGQPIEVLVMRGLPEEAFETYDKQAKKAPVVEGEFEEFGDKALISATAVLLWRRELKPAGQPNARPTATEVREVIRTHPELMRLRGFARKMTRHGRSSAMLYAAHRILRDDATLGQVFLDRLETAANLPAGHLILRLRDRLIDLRKADQNTQIDEIMAAWEKFRKKPGIPL
ncbi:conserved protein of unknown function (plasmid) [Rhodovastum atsumiense]|uniref:hypothetical protein n=1 Tax=Rhodovastum atsumiense TaxID=504468 RepID=UPI0020250133|nr:hypothetical protein [Rhodovastum atsumiense]CAH2605605.1 conserved protein of unknown function [Rhodovastum atsumiense]